MEAVQRVVGHGQVVARVDAGQEVLPQGQLLRPVVADEAFGEGRGLVCKSGGCSQDAEKLTRGIRFVPVSR